MATARTTPPPETPEGEAPATKAEIAAMIAEAVGGATPPPTAPEGPRKLTDDEWDAMTDRGRESWVRKLVDFRLDELSRDDEVRRLAAEVAGLAAGPAKPEPEKSPGMMTRLQKLVWGDRDQ